MKRLIRITFFLTFLSTAQHSFAWGRTGHQLIAAIAEYILKEPVKEHVHKYLGNISFMEASVWMDEVRSDHHYDYMKPWHYINIEKEENYVSGNGANIIDRLNNVYAELQNKQQLSTETITMDLLILFHLVGDLFQPLHVAYGFDKGGNAYQVSLNGKGTNLHHVWDTEIIESEDIRLDHCLALYTTLTASQKNHLSNLDFVEWMKEDRKLLEGIYPAGHKIDNEYINKNKGIVISQLVYAGIKLAAVLESLFTVPDVRVINQPKVEIIIAEDAAKYIGKKVTVCAMVYGIKELPSVNFLNVGGSYPDNPLTIVIFSEDKENFKDGLLVYNNKHICVTGIIKDYKGKPEIIVSHPHDISVQ